MATFTNQATLSYNNITLSSNIATGEMVELLTADKTAVVPTYTAGDTLTYVISLVNEGDSPLTDLTITDDLGGYEFEGETLYPLTYVDGSIRYFLDGTLQSAPDVDAGAPLVIEGIRVNAESSTLVIYQAQVNEFAPLDGDGEILNTATISGCGLCDDVVVSETVTTVDGPVLALLKEVTPCRVMCDGQVTYTLTVSNSGNEAADTEDDLIIRDTFQPVLSGLAVTFNGAPWVQGTHYTYNQTTGEFATVAGQVTVPAAAFTQDPVTGVITTVPGTAVLAITGTI